MECNPQSVDAGNTFLFYFTGKCLNIGLTDNLI